MYKDIKKGQKMAQFREDLWFLGMGFIGIMGVIIGYGTMFLGGLAFIATFPLISAAILGVLAGIAFLCMYGAVTS